MQGMPVHENCIHLQTVNVRLHITTVHWSFYYIYVSCGIHLIVHALHCEKQTNITLIS